jgi:hypothetical protein
MRRRKMTDIGHRDKNITLRDVALPLGVFGAVALAVVCINGVGSVVQGAMPHGWYTMDKHKCVPLEQVSMLTTFNKDKPVHNPLELSKAFGGPLLAPITVLRQNRSDRLDSVQISIGGVISDIYPRDTCGPGVKSITELHQGPYDDSELE